MKITPINFSILLEPELIQFWEEKSDSEDTTIQIRRAHNFKLRHTELTCVAVDSNEDTTVLGQVLLIDIPQQEENASLNCMIHLPEVQAPTQLLMVFKTEEDNAKWVRRIIDKIRSLLEAQARRNLIAETPPEPELEPVAEAEAEESVSAFEDGDIPVESETEEMETESQEAEEVELAEEPEEEDLAEEPEKEG